MNNRSKQLILKAVFCFLLAIGANSSVYAQKSETINWQTDYKQALAISRETGKPILIDFWAKWCKPCLMMEQEYWARPDVVETMKNFVPLKLNYDEEKDLAKRFAVRGLPYIAYSDPLGNLAGFRRGYQAKDAETMSVVFKHLPKNFSPLKKAYQAIETNPKNAAALLEVAEFYEKNQIFGASGEFYKRAYYVPEIQFDPAKKEPILAKAGRQFALAGMFEPAAKSLEEYLRIFDDGAYLELVYAALAAADANLGKLPEAGKYLDLLKKNFPQSKEIAATEKEIEKARKAQIKPSNKY